MVLIPLMNYALNISKPLIKYTLLTRGRFYLSPYFYRVSYNIPYTQSITTNKGETIIPEITILYLRGLAAPFKFLYCPFKDLSKCSIIAMIEQTCCLVLFYWLT